MNSSVNYQDFSVINSCVKTIANDLKEKYKKKVDSGASFIFFILEYFFDFQEDQVDEAISDTHCLKILGRDAGNDSGVDAIFIDEENKIVNIINCKYGTKFENINKNFPSNELEKIFSFIDNLFVKDTSDIENEVLNEKSKEIFAIQDSGQILHFNIFFISNYSCGIENKKLESFKTKISNRGIGRYITIKNIVLKDLVDKVIKPNCQINAQVKSIAGNFFEKSEGGNRALIMELYAKDIIRIVSDSEDIRNDINADLAEIRKAKIEEASFNDNVRIYLHQRTNVNKSIKQTAEDDIESANFFFYNNGITIICDDIEYQGKRDTLIKLKNIQIVNGSQTIHSLKEALDVSDNVEDVSLLCKIYQVKNNDNLKAKIAQYTNNQNPIRGRDICSVDEIQIKLEKEFEKLGFYYERKKDQYKREASKEKRLDSEKIGQILMVYNLGKPAEAKSRKSMVFGVDYSNIFNSDISAEDILYKYELYTFIEKKKRELSNAYSFLKYATYYILYFSAIYIYKNSLSLNNLILNNDSCEKIYDFAFTCVKRIVDKEREKQGDNFLENVLFKGNIPKNYISELELSTECFNLKM